MKLLLDANISWKLVNILTPAKSKIEDLESDEYGLLEIYGPSKIINSLNV
jgi:predicted nuclease of predicted toxin-antitoxin system